MPKIFHGEFSSADASALTEPNSRVTLYDTAGVAITLASTEQVVITDVTVIVGVDLAVDLYDGANNVPAAGEYVWRGSMLAASQSASYQFKTAHYCATGTYPKVKTGGAGQVDVIIHGFIL